MTGVTLVVMAAGLGSRFGGPKQLTAVGPSGEVILDYSLRDARAAGIDNVVLVVNSAIESAMRARLAGQPGTTFVCQDLDPFAVEATAAGRRKPLGTAHATLVGLAAAGSGPALVINADDLYGRHPYHVVATQLLANRSGGALATFAVRNTITGPGAVTRALCDVGPDGRLRGIEEGTVDGTRWRGRTGREVAITGDEPVSMNFWGFPASARTVFADAVHRFVESGDAATDAEVLLPDVVRALIDAGTSFAAIPTPGRCIGVTHPGDLELVRALVQEA